MEDHFRECSFKLQINNIFILFLSRKNSFILFLGKRLAKDAELEEIDGFETAEARMVYRTVNRNRQQIANREECIGEWRRNTFSKYSKGFLYNTLIRPVFCYRSETLDFNTQDEKPHWF